MLWIVVILIVIIIILAIILIYYNWCRSVLFLPDYDVIWRPKEDYEDLILPETGCNAWYFERKSKYPIVLYLHGNAGNISYRQYVVDLTKRVKCNLFLLDYRGYGKSKPNYKPSTKSVKEDAEESYRWLREKYTSDKIIVWGESLGGAPSAYIASKYPCKSLIMFSTFSSLDDLVKYYFEGPVGSILGNVVKYTFTPFKSKDWIKDVKCPVLIVHSSEDKLINYQNALILYQTVHHDHKMLLTIKGDHTDPKISPEGVKLIHRFCYSSDDNFMSGEEAQELIDELELGTSLLREHWENRDKISID